MAAIYVGTYAKYNAGSLFGKWLNPEDFDDKQEFLDACRELHIDEDDPELMFQDWEGVPPGMVSECHVSEDLWDWLELSDTAKEILSLYREHVDSNGTIEQAEEAFRGVYRSAADWAEEYLSDTGALNEVPESLRYFIDFDAYARDAAHGGMSFVDTPDGVYVFS